MKKTFYSLTKTQKQSLLIVFGISIIIKLTPLPNFVSETFSLAFHELGHAVTAWSFGHFAIPRFDFINGGGVTHIFDRSLLFGSLVYIFVLANFIHLKITSMKISTKSLWVIFIAYNLLFFTPLRYSMFTFMGKGGELLFCFFVGWYALNQLKSKLEPKAAIYLLLFIILWINSVQDSISLLYNESEKSKYINGIDQLLGGSPLMNDLVKLSNSSGFSINSFNWLLLLFAIYAFYKTIQFANTPPITKNETKKYMQHLLITAKYQIKNTPSNLLKLKNDKDRKK